ncbi:hypothetical protein RLIN73S_03267 [Rhodanobacter lindaniclasticus]
MVHLLFGRLVEGQRVGLHLLELHVLDPGQLLLRIRPVRVDRVLGAVEGQQDVPVVDAAAARVFFVFLRGGHAGLGVHGQQFLVALHPLGLHHQRHRVERRCVAREPDQALILQVVDDVDQGHDVAVARHRDPAREEVFWLGHHPEAHLGDDAEVRLREQAVDVGAVAVLVVRPALGARHGGHARAHQLTVRQHHLHAAVGAVVVAVGVPGVADAVVQRVAQRTAPARVGDVHHHLELVILDVLVQIEVGHAGFDHAEVALVVDLDDLVHAL